MGTAGDDKSTIWVKKYVCKWNDVDTDSFKTVIEHNLQVWPDFNMQNRILMMQLMRQVRYGEISWILEMLSMMEWPVKTGWVYFVLWMNISN